MLDTISLSGLSFESVIGIYPSERAERQSVVLDIALGLDTRPAALGDIARTVDYARLSGEVKFLMHACRFALLETAAEALCRYILASPTPDQPRAQVEQATVWLKKPSVQATLQVTRSAREYRRNSKAAPFGRVETLFATTDLAIHRVQIARGKQWLARTGDAQHLVLGDALRLQNRPVPAGSGVFWDADQVFRYDNTGRTPQTVLVVARPKLALGTAAGPLRKAPPAVAYYPAEHALPHAAT